VIGDIDFTVVRPAEPDPAFERVKAAFDAAVRDAGRQPDLGARLLAMTYQRLRPRLLTFGAAEADLAQVLKRLQDKAFRWHGPALWTVAARRP
jgi:hypothetical protein